MTADKKWKYSYGIHQGTTVSRDLGEPKLFETEQECKDYHRDNRNWMQSIGYKIWFATITEPNGKEMELSRVFEIDGEQVMFDTEGNPYTAALCGELWNPTDTEIIKWGRTAWQFSCYGRGLQ